MPSNSRIKQVLERDGWVFFIFSLFPLSHRPLAVIQGSPCDSLLCSTKTNIDLRRIKPLLI